MSENNAKKSTGLSGRFAAFSALSGRDKARKISDLLFNNAMFIIIFISIFYSAFIIIIVIIINFPIYRT